MAIGAQAHFSPANTGATAEHERLARSLIGAAKPSSVLWTSASAAQRRIQLFGWAIDNTTLQAAARDLATAGRDGRRTRAVFVNAHAVNTSMNDPAYQATITSAGRIYADGSGMAVAARLAGRPLAENVNGTDMFPLLCQEAIKASTRIFLLGGKPGIAEKVAANLGAFGLGAAIAGTHHGYFDRDSSEEDDLVARINASGAGIVLVGLGVPLQDQWAERNAGRLDAAVVAGVGGLFDFFAGEVSRSPKVMRTIGCEWMWRLAMEPRRMAHRYLIGNAIFLGRAILEARRTKNEPRPAKSFLVNVSETSNL